MKIIPRTIFTIVGEVDLFVLIIIIHITLGHMVLPAGAPTVILSQHLLHQLVLQGGQLLEDVQGRGWG